MQYILRLVISPNEHFNLLLIPPHHLTEASCGGFNLHNTG